ncbi:MDR family MFS transporter [Nakamurella lactea]|uniref:MDR family MFS transporter n=1 Tax=Nakamurella lactea TaxID=459515 RepID=UPI00041FD05D|nr:MDR family MFS transporter [Nakamurella lactea]
MTQEQISRASIGLRSERGPVLLSVMLSTGLVAIDSTILATAVTSIVDDLGGFHQFPWLFSVYLLGQAVAVPIYGKLADIVGRKTIMLFGIATFVVGSILCGIAWSMPMLIAFRAVQGLGAGAVQPMAMTIVGDLYTVAERAKVQGYVASVWAIAAVVGPTLGGVFSDYLNWRWIFFVNVPLGAAAAVMLTRRFHEKVTRSQHRIDFAGAILLALGSTMILLGLLEGGVLWEWISWQSATVLIGGLVVLVAFVFVERRASEPILPGWIFGRRVFNGSNLSSLTVGALLIGLTSFVPLFAEGVLKTTALVAGFALAAMTIGWPLSSSNSGRLYLRIGFRYTALIGACIALLGSLLMLLLTQGSSVFFVAFACFVVGLGLGLVAAPTLIAAQSSVAWQRRGVVTGANVFARSMGSAVGVAVFGAIANASMSVRVGAPGGGTAADVPVPVLAGAIHHVFIAAAVVAVLMVAAVLVMPARVDIID